MTRTTTARPGATPSPLAALKLLSITAGALALAACGGPSSMGSMSTASAPSTLQPLRVTPPSPDPRVGLKPGLFDAGEAAWNMRVLSATPPPEAFVGAWNSDLAFKGDYAIQGNYNGVQIWDISDPLSPDLVIGYVCPASQSDVSVYGNLLFVSGEGMGGRLDCGTEGVPHAVSQDRLRGIRIFDITDIRDPKYIANVQTCRGSHTHTVLEDPNDRDNVYIYVSGSATVRPAEELPGCVDALPADDPNSALFRIEVIRVPLANPERAAIVSSPRIFENLVAPPTHGLAPEDLAAVERAGAGRDVSGNEVEEDAAELGPTQCHDITVYPAIGLAGGACEGYGLLLDIKNPTSPRRLAAVADSNFAYWHSATFSNDGKKVMFTDEWGGGSAPKCRATDPKEWGANAIFTIEGQDMEFQSYFKLSAPQTPEENCVAHNGSLIPIPGRDIMVQGWYQGGISVLDWTDPTNAVEIAFHDRGPVDGSRMMMAGSWSVYWYNGVIVSSEIARGLDIFELLPSDVLSQNEIDAAKSVRWEQLNSQGQPEITWPNSFALARAYVDQLERRRGMAPSRVTAVRAALAAAEQASGSARRTALNTLASELERDVNASPVGEKTRMLAEAVRGLAADSR